MKVLLPAIGALFLQARAFSQSPNYTGTWVLNNEKSKIESRAQGMTSTIFIIQQEKMDFSLTIHPVFGEYRDTILISMPSDGKTRKVLGTFQGKLEQKGDHLQVTIWKKGLLDKVKYRFGATTDEFIADEVLVSEADNHHNIWVFDRQPVQNQRAEGPC